MLLESKDAFYGCTKTIILKILDNCRACNGSGVQQGANEDKNVCPTCKGFGKIQERTETVFGMTMVAKKCAFCDGTGLSIKFPCKQCAGKGRILMEKNIPVAIPAGVHTGNRLCVKGVGGFGKNGAVDGDLYIDITVNVS